MGVGEGVVAEWNIPTQQPLINVELLGEAEQAVQHVLSRCRRNALVGEQPLHLARTAAIETQPDFRGNGGGKNARAQRQLHMH